MNRNDFNRAVAKATGESVETVAHRGFVLLTPVPLEREPRRASYDDLLRRTCSSEHLQTRSRAAA